MALPENRKVVVVIVNPIFHSKFKHVKLDLFFVREKVDAGTLQVGHFPNQDQVVDVLAKPLSIG